MHLRFPFFQYPPDPWRPKPIWWPPWFPAWPPKPSGEIAKGTLKFDPPKPKDK